MRSVRQLKCYSLIAMVTFTGGYKAVGLQKISKSLQKYKYDDTKSEICLFVLNEKNMSLKWVCSKHIVYTDKYTIRCLPLSTFYYTLTVLRARLSDNFRTKQINYFCLSTELKSFWLNNCPLSYKNPLSDVPLVCKW